MSFEAELSTPPDWLSVSGRFDESCRIRLSDVTCDAIRGGALRLRVLQHGSASVIRRASLSLSATRGNIVIHLGSDDSTVSFGEQTLGAWDLRLWRESTVSIADNCSSNGARIVVDKSEVTLGADCMLSDTVLIQSADQHGIVDLLTGALINDRRRATAIGRHVWLGRRSTLMPCQRIASRGVEQVVNNTRIVG